MQSGRCKTCKGHRDEIQEADPFEEGIDAANKSPFTLLGKIRVSLKYCSKEVEEEIAVVKEDTVLLIQWSTCIELGILHEGYPAPLEARRVSKPANQTFLEKFLSRAKDPKEPTKDEKALLEALLEKFGGVFSVETQL